MKKILIASPIKQKANILKEFFTSLEELNKKDLDISYFFVDDNNDEAAKKVIKKFVEKNKNVMVKTNTDYQENNNNEYICNDYSHDWKKASINRIIKYKNYMIEKAIADKCDYIFFIDSDIVLNPKTLHHLIEQNVDIVSNVFWTKWTPTTELCPQVWMQDESNFYIRNWDKPYTENEIKQISNDFINMLKVPGLYKVGGLGACTLISRKALIKGVSFSLIDNVSFWGEDRHFCIRAEVLGLDLYVDTVYPAYHIYREHYLSGVTDYKKHGFDPNNYVEASTVMDKLKNRSKIKKEHKIINKIKHYVKRYLEIRFKKKRIINDDNNITVSMIVHNEADRYLERVLKSAKRYASNFVIIDDASTDNTVEVCEKVLKDVKHKIVKNNESLFKNEYKLRMEQWKETIATNPDWIMFLDADEEFEEEFVEKYMYLLKNKNVDAYQFRLYDMWNELEYRQDDLWNPNIYRPFLIRYQPKFNYKFKKTNQHCGRLPYNATSLETANSIFRVKHYGWMNENDRKAKYDRYKKLDPEGKDGDIKQYESILDKNPNLVPFDNVKG